MKSSGMSSCGLTFEGLAGLGAAGQLVLIYLSRFLDQETAKGAF